MAARPHAAWRRRLPPTRHSLPAASWLGKTAEHFHGYIRAETITTRAIFRWLRNIEPIAIDIVARGSDGSENIFCGNLLSARIGADPCKYLHFRIRFPSLRCGLRNEICI